MYNVNMLRITCSDRKAINSNIHLAVMMAEGIGRDPNITKN